MIFLKRPDSFVSHLDAVSCFLEVDGYILLLLRQNFLRVEPGKWGVPAGKVEKGETKEEAMVREFFEETGNNMHPNRFRFISTLYVEYPHANFNYHMYRLKMARRPRIVINPHEHRDFLWATPSLALRKNLMQDEDFCIKLVYGL